MTRTRIPLAALLALSSACAAEIGDSTDVGLEETEAMSYNAMSYNAMSYNALTASFDAVTVMAEVPLATESYDPSVGYPELMFALHDSLTRDFMKYLVSCALDPTQNVLYKDPFTSVTYKWQGSMGFCSEWGDPGGSADDGCRQVVSACLLSRVNAFGSHVRLSQRGHFTSYATPEPILLAPVVPAGDTYLNGSLVSGLTKKCLPGTTGPVRECSWKPSQSGTCTPGQTVTVGLGAPPASACFLPPIGNSFGADTVLRVCGGITGCKQIDPKYLGQANNTCGTTFPSVTFTCPSSGFFTTMVGHNVATSTPSAPTWTPGVRNGLFRNEIGIFGYQEAAFYGDVFDAHALNPKVNIYVDPNGEVHGRADVMQKPVPGAIYTSMFACWSPVWTKGDAYATNRVCGGPTKANCAAIPIGACRDNNTPPPPPPTPAYPSFVCSSKDDPLQLGDNDFQFCNDLSGRRWDHAMTVFLNNPCDVIRNPNICENIYGVLAED